MNDVAQLSPSKTTSKITYKYQIYLQPEYTTGRKLCSCEALIRMIDSHHKVRSPDEFLPYISDANELLEIGRISLKKSLKILDLWQQKGWPAPNISVNLSLAQLQIPALRTFYLNTLKKHRDLSSKISFEMAEQILLSGDPDILRFIYAVTDLGVTFVIDDIVSHVSAIGYLQAYPVRAIKIDSEILSEIKQHQTVCNSKAISELISGVQVIAKRIQNQKEYQEFKDFRVSGYQGNYFGEPCVFQEFERRFLH